MNIFKKWVNKLKLIFTHRLDHLFVSTSVIAGSQRYRPHYPEFSAIEEKCWKIDSAYDYAEQFNSNSRSTLPSPNYVQRSIIENYAQYRKLHMEMITSISIVDK